MGELYKSGTRAGWVGLELQYVSGHVIASLREPLSYFCEVKQGGTTRYAGRSWIDELDKADRSSWSDLMQIGLISEL
jgi:hypothetical protein